MTKQTILEFGEEKKWSVRYNEPASTPITESIIKSAYIQKTALTKPYPRKLRITIESAEDVG